MSSVSLVLGQLSIPNTLILSSYRESVEPLKSSIILWVGFAVNFERGWMCGKLRGIKDEKSLILDDALQEMSV